MDRNGPDLGSGSDIVIDLNPPSAKKIVMNFLEEWEEQEPEAGKRKKRGAVHEQNAGNQFRLLNKYQGLHFFDDECGEN